MVSPNRLIFIVCIYVIIKHHYPVLGEGLCLQFILTPTSLKSETCNWVLVVRWCYHILYIHQPVSFLHFLFLICHFGGFYSWLCGIAFCSVVEAICWPVVANFYAVLVSCRAILFSYNWLMTKAACNALQTNHHYHRIQNFAFPSYH